MPQFGDRWDNPDWIPTRARGGDASTVSFPPATAMSANIQTPPAQPDYGTFEIPSYGGASSPSFAFQDVPAFHAPQFHQPTFAEAQNEPGYQFRLDAGQKALERSAAARGITRTGGSLKDLLEYGQNFGASEYSNVFNRALQAYGTKYQGARDEYAPLLAQYQNQFGAEQARGMAAFQQQFQEYQAQLQAQMMEEQWRNSAMQTPYPTFPTYGG